MRSGWTPLHVAAENDQFDVAITLLRAGAGVDVAREDGATALHVAAGNGFADIVTLLLRKGADMEAVTRDRWYPLHMSCGNGHSAVTELLLRKGASVDATADAGTWRMMTVQSAAKMQLLESFDTHAVVLECCESYLRAHADSFLLSNTGNIGLPMSLGVLFATPVFVFFRMGLAAHGRLSRP